MFRTIFATAVVSASVILPPAHWGVQTSAVTQQNLKTTVCVSGYTSTVRPPVAYTNKLKSKQVIAFKYSDQVLSHYEEDHFVPLELGGAPKDPHNLWPEPRAQSSVSDPLENKLHTALCSGKITLSEARRQIKAFKRTHG